MNEYEKQANDFLEKTGATIKVEYVKTDFYFPEDEALRDIYKFTITRGARKYSATFAQSVAKSSVYIDKAYGRKCIIIRSDGTLFINQKKIKIYPDMLKEYIRRYCIRKKGTPPTNYDILACMTAYDPGTFEEFCGSYGYDSDSRKAESAYKAVVKEFVGMSLLFNDEELELLADIN